MNIITLPCIYSDENTGRLCSDVGNGRHFKFVCVNSMYVIEFSLKYDKKFDWGDGIGKTGTTQIVEIQ